MISKDTYSRQIIRCIYLICLFVVVCLNARSQETTLTVIGNQKGVPSQIKLSDLKSIFKAERQRWEDGTKVSIAMIKSTTPVGQLVSRRIYSKTGDEVRGFWAGISFAGKFESPVTFNTISEVESYVAQTAGAIAILDKAPESQDVKTILVDGKKSF